MNRLVVTGAAARYLQVLEDFGHLTSGAPARVVLGAAELGLHENGSVRLDDVRRSAAILLFSTAANDGTAEVLSQDWPLLFS